jgi:hypothetical protein
MALSRRDPGPEGLCARDSGRVRREPASTSVSGSRTTCRSGARTPHRRRGIHSRRASSRFASMRINLPGIPRPTGRRACPRCRRVSSRAPSEVPWGSIAFATGSWCGSAWTIARSTRRRMVSSKPAPALWTIRDDFTRVDLPIDVGAFHARHLRVRRPLTSRHVSEGARPRLLPRARSPSGATPLRRRPARAALIPPGSKPRRGSRPEGRPRRRPR